MDRATDRAPDRATHGRGAAGAPSAPTFRQRFRARLRDEILDAAYAITVEDGWEHVRMTALAARVGVSRQTLYKHFGSKDDVGEALVVREAERFHAGVIEHADEHDDLSGSVRAAISFTLRHGAANPLLRTVLAGSQSGEQSLLPYITTGSGPLLDATISLVREHLRSRDPALASEHLDTLADMIVRLSVSHLLRPTAPVETTADRITRLVAAYVARYAGS
jgi:AcrR family transcriptional regulator